MHGLSRMELSGAYNPPLHSRDDFSMLIILQCHPFKGKFPACPRSHREFGALILGPNS